MADQAHEWTDEQIEALERKFNSTYSQAEREMRAKLDEYLKDFDEKNKVWQAEVRAGKATHEQYQGWLKSQSLRREYLSDMCDTLAADASRTNQLAFDMINDKLPRIYAENANYAAYSIESQLHSNTHAFDLVDQSTVRRLMGLDDDGQVIKEVVLTEEEVSPPLRTLRKVNVKKAKDVRWNRQKFNAALTQSILQGESIPNTAKRMARVLNMDKNMAVRAARTAMTSAENAGRVDSYHRAKRIGIDLEQEWLAALDERTRHSHRELDGQHVPVGRKFKVPSSGHELEFPGDPTAHPSEVWNCRCTLVAWFPEDGEESAEGRFSRLPKGMTYEQWKAGKAKAVAELKDESGRWANEAGRVSATWYAAKTKGGTAAEGVMLKEALDDYIHGAYEGIVNAANIEIGGFGEFDSVLDADFVASKGKSAFYTAEEAERAKAIVEAIESQEPTSMPVVRTEWRRSAPSEGDELRWGIKSASMDGDFAHKVASGEIEGMNGFLSRGLPSNNGDLLVYHIEGPHRQLDISPLSDYESQQEVLLHGKFEVQRVTEEIYDTGIKTNRAIELTPRQWAEQEGLEIEYFTSKKGKPMARFGTRTYPVDQMDRPSSAFVSGMETDKVTLRHVYIRRTDM